MVRTGESVGRSVGCECEILRHDDGDVESGVEGGEVAECDCGHRLCVGRPVHRVAVEGEAKRAVAVAVVLRIRVQVEEAPKCDRAVVVDVVEIGDGRGAVVALQEVEVLELVQSGRYLLICFLNKILIYLVELISVFFFLQCEHP
jgi:hypothetical protein